MINYKYYSSFYTYLFMQYYLIKKFFKIIAFAFIFFPVSAFAIDTVPDGFLVNDVRAVEIDAHSVCKVVLSKSGTAYFVGTKEANEWSSFRNQPSTQLNARFEMYDCSLPQSSCTVGYQYRLDNGRSAEKYTPATDNTSVYGSGAWSVKITGKDDTCNGSDGCGLRSRVQCTGDYDIKVDYQYVGEGVNAPLRTTGWSSASTGWGPWSTRSYETGDSECSSGSGGCDIKMWIADDHPDVTCSIGYKHRTDETVSGWAYDGAPANVNNNGSGDGENCENGGCGMQVRVYCEGPPGGYNPSTNLWQYSGEGQVGSQCSGNTVPTGTCSPAGSNCYVSNTIKGVTTSQTYQCGNGSGGSPPAAVNGQCGGANGNTYTTAAQVNAAGLCNLGTPTPSPVQGAGAWGWTCQGINGGTTATCNALTNASNGTWGYLSSGSGTSNPEDLCGGNLNPTGDPCSPVGDTCRVSNNIKGGSTYDTYRCNAPPGPIAGACGDANGNAYPTAAAVNSAGLCSAGTSAAVSGSGPWSWTCAGVNGGASSGTCTASVSSAVNGICGNANGNEYSSASAVNAAGLCSAGSASPSSVSGSGPWSWDCLGSGGGTDANFCIAIEEGGFNF